MKACYSSVQNFLLFLLSKRIKIKFTEEKFFLSFDVGFKHMPKTRLPGCRR
jgi:hypothetical protein